MPKKVRDVFLAEHFSLNSISATRRGQMLAAYDRYERFLDGKPMEDAGPEDLRAFLVALLEFGLLPTTVTWYLRMIKPFYRWRWENRAIDAEMHLRFVGVKPPRGGNYGMPRPYTPAELAELWAALEKAWPHANEGRLARWERGTIGYLGPIRKHAMRLQLEAMLELALVCGLRRKEIFNLTIDDCHWDNRYLVVHGKRVDHRPKVRKVPYPDSTREAITAWWRFRVTMKPAEDARFWLSVTGPEPSASLSPFRMRQILVTLGDWELHRLRHTCATTRLRAGMPLEQLQKFLGHSNAAMTLRYAQILPGDVEKAAEASEAAFQAAIRPKRKAA